MNILQNKVKNDRTAHQYNRDASQALTALRITIAETQDRLGREIEQTRKLRGYVEDERANVVQLRKSVLPDIYTYNIADFIPLGTVQHASLVIKLTS